MIHPIAFAFCVLAAVLVFILTFKGGRHDAERAELYREILKLLRERLK